MAFRMSKHVTDPGAPYRGLWVALDNCRYNAKTGKPAEGDVVDADSELSRLCSRIRESGRCSCAILFCDDRLKLESCGPSKRFKAVS